MRKEAPLRAQLLALLLLVAAVSPPMAVASSIPPVYAENGYQPQKLSIKPHGYYSHVSVHNLTWANWGQATATASGTFTFQFCVQESCSVSPFYDQPVSVSLTQIKSCRARPAYTVLTLTIAGPLPDPSFKAYRTSLGSCQPRSSGGRRAHR